MKALEALETKKVQELTENLVNIKIILKKSYDLCGSFFLFKG